MHTKVLIIGAGPAGLGAAWRLRELGCDDFLVAEKESFPGGLCASFRDPKGFQWDLGGHVYYARSEYFRTLGSRKLKVKTLSRRRNSWVRIMDRWVPYPLQRNLSYLPEPVAAQCMRGLARGPSKPAPEKNFKQWLLARFGKPLCEHFLFPYNEKIWACDLRTLSASWTSGRVSPSRRKGSDKAGAGKGWGANAEFVYPYTGGAGGWFTAMARPLAPRVCYGAEACVIDPRAKEAVFSNGMRVSYDALITTMPLDLLLLRLAGKPAWASKAAAGLAHNGILVVGVGIKRPPASDKCWVYFPEASAPFFRATYLSNYSPRNVPDPKKYYSLLCETSYSSSRPQDKASIVERTIAGLRRTGILARGEEKAIASVFLRDVPYAYPRPTVSRDASLAAAIPRLERMGIFSRGRFGGWRYESGNTDDAVLQGKEAAERVLR